MLTIEAQSDIQLIVLDIIGEYLGRIYDEVRARPLYIAREAIEE